MPIQEYTLDQLDHSPKNARTTRSKAAIEQRAASIKAHGLLQNLVVHPMENGKMGVAIGGTRLEALRLLAKRKEIPQDFVILADLRAADDPTLTEASLAENISREPMNPADEFSAFKGLADEGQGPETIAARFGVTPTVVKQRLKLAAVSPKLMKVFRADEMTLDQLMAFTLTDDHKAQEKVWRDLPDWAKKNDGDREIRAALTEQHSAADGKLAQFVGIEAYTQAGGHITRDLFADEADGGWLTDTGLLNRMVEEKLAAAAETVQAEGWKWVRHAPVFSYEDTQKDGRLQPSYAPPAPEQQAKIDAIQAEADGIMAERGDEPEDEVASERLRELQQELDDMPDGVEVWTDAQKSVSGAYVTIGHDGHISIKRGAVKPEDKAAVRKLNGAAGHGDDADEREAPAKVKGGLSAALITELTSHKTVAAQLVMATNTKVALLAVTHALALRQFYQHSFAEHSSLGISSREPSYSLAIRESVDKSPAAKKLATIVKGWQKKLPKKPEQLWAWMETQTPATLQSILAVCAASTIDIVQLNGSDAKPASKALAKAIKLDVTQHWEATSENFFTRVPRKTLFAELGAAITPVQRKQMESMKREPMARALTSALKGKHWIPSCLRND